MRDIIPSTYEKAFGLNLNRSIYGTFAEIGAGQETGNWFFRVGASSGTIAKTMSAYDMTFSDEVYGPCGRYVSRARLGQMLDHEYDILVERLAAARGTDTTFFAFANTVRARGYQDTGECHGWAGIRFQACPGGETTEILMHVRMLDEKNADQQEALGIVGVNLVYGAFHYRDDLPTFVGSLTDNLEGNRIEVDMLKFEGAGCGEIDNRLCALQLVESGLASAALFNKEGEVLQPAEQFYKKPILLLRGSFDPVTHVHLDMLESARKPFVGRLDGDGDSGYEEIMEISMRNLLRSDGRIDHADFIRRADSLRTLGKAVLISDFARFHRAGAYLSRYTNQPVGIILGLPLLEQLFEEKWYTDLDGGILESFGRLFKHKIRLYVYPIIDADSGKLRSAEDTTIAPHLKHLFQHLFENRFIESLNGCNKNVAHQSSRDVAKMIGEDDPAWKNLVPKEVAKFYDPTH